MCLWKKIMNQKKLKNFDEKCFSKKYFRSFFFVFLKVRKKSFPTHPGTSKSVHGARRNRGFKLVSKSEISEILMEFL